jgi:hypothetical protein
MRWRWKRGDARGAELVRAGDVDKVEGGVGGGDRSGDGVGDTHAEGPRFARATWEPEI